MNFAKKKLNLKGGKNNNCSDDEFQNNVLQFNALSGKVKSIDESLKKYQKTITKIQPSLEKLAQALCEFYTEEDYEQYGKEFQHSTQIVNQAIQGFQVEQSSISQQIEDYLSRISVMKKNLSEREKLYNAYKSKEKESQKTTGKKEVVAVEKFQAAKDSYEVKHEEVSRELAELLASKNTDFEGNYIGIVEAQIHLFSKISNSFEMPSLGILASTKISDEIESVPSLQVERSRLLMAAPAKPPRSKSPNPISQIPQDIKIPVEVPPRPPPLNTEMPVIGIGLGPAPLPPGVSHLPLAPTPTPIPIPAQAPLPPAPVPSDLVSVSKIPVIPESERKQYEELFHHTDTMRLGYLNGQSAFALFSQSGLLTNDLALIWELADQDKDGNLICEEFVLAMYLINSKRRNPSTPIPTSIPPEWIISLRHNK